MFPFVFIVEERELKKRRHGASRPCTARRLDVRICATSTLQSSQLDMLCDRLLCWENKRNESNICATGVTQASLQFGSVRVRLTYSVIVIREGVPLAKLSGQMG